MFRSEIMALGPKVTSIKHNKLQQYHKSTNYGYWKLCPNNLMLLHDQSHPIPTIPFGLQRGNYSHMDGGNMAGRWRGVGGDDGDDLLQFPVPAECQNGDFWLPRRSFAMWRRSGGFLATSTSLRAFLGRGR